MSDKAFDITIALILGGMVLTMMLLAASIVIVALNIT